MSQADNDDTTDEEAFEYYPQATQHPTTIIEGDIVNIVTGADIDGEQETTGSSFGVVYENPEVAVGSLWQNEAPDGFSTVGEYNDTLRLAIEGTDNNYVRGQEVTDEAVEEAQQRLEDAGVDYEDGTYEELSVNGTDFKVADQDDRDARVGYNSEGEQTGIDVGGGEFESHEVEGFGDTDKVMVWYGGMAGQFVGRALDFNGMPFARYTDDGYLVKGLFDVPLGWKNDDVEQYDSVPTTDRGELARPQKNGGLGRPPRVARPPVLRDDIDGRAFVAIGRYNGGDMHEVHIGRAEDDYSEIEAAMRDDEDPTDLFDAIEMKYEQDADEILDGEFDGDVADIYAVYHGEGWQPEPENAGGDSDTDTDGASFDVSTADDEDDGVDHPTDTEQTFAHTVVEKIAGTGDDPDTALDGDLETVVEANSDNFDVEADVDAIRRVIYEESDHLSTEDL